MGIIIKQSIKGSIWSYVGVVIGFVTTAYLYSNYLSTEMVGLFGLLLSYSVMFAQFSSLGINGVTSRLFPYFRDKEKAHNGYLFIVFFAAIIGFGLFLLVYFIFSPKFIESNIEKSKLFADYAYLLIPLTFFMLLFSVLDIYNKLLYNAVLGTFLQEFFQRILIFFVVLFYAIGIINSKFLILFFVVAASAKGVYLLIYLILNGKFSLRPKLDFLTKKLRKEITSVALYSILTGVGGSIVFNIDKIVVNQILGLSSTGIYAMGYFFGILVLIPSRPLLRISGTLIAEAWKRDDRKYILDIYTRSCINQFIIAAFLFGGIWINIDNILVILGSEYVGAKWVIFFIGIANLIEMATGGNAQVIAFSKYYRVSLYFLLILIILVIGLIIFLTPLWGITGAAFAITIAIFANNLMRFIFILWKFRMQPFSMKNLFVIIVFLIAFFVSSILPQMQLILDILIRSSIFTLVFFIITIYFKISKDINQLVISVLGKYFKLKNDLET